MTFDNISHLWASVIIDQCIKNGVQDFFTCPGMRNAPLLRSAHDHDQAQTYVGWDERAQSYRALGFIKASGKPAALICTSGTAVANTLPAVIEAQKTNLPLIIISADRPVELNAVDANQTINQIEVLRDYTKSFWHLSEPQENYPLNVLAGHLSHTIAEAKQHPCGPLHLNVPLREPLDQAHENIDSSLQEIASRMIGQSQAHLNIHTDHSNTRIQNHVTEVLEQLKKAKFPIVVFAPLSRTFKQQIALMNTIQQHCQVPFYCDVETGGKFYFGSEQNLIPTFDHPEVLDHLNSLKPDCIIHIGHRVTSKHYYNFLKKHCGAASIIHVCDSHQHQDPGYSFQTRYACDPYHFIQCLSETLNQPGTKINAHKPNWQELIAKKENIIESGPLSYAYLSKKVIENVPDGHQMFIGNSTFIRSFDSYACFKAPKKDLRIFANRGASGIEGHLATTLGLFDGEAKPTLAFLGDVSFIHDLGSLAYFSELAQKQSLPLLIVTANNKGGGIFKLLPIAKDKKTLPLLTTDHSMDLHPVISAFNIKTKSVHTKEDYLQALKDWFKKPELLFLEVMIDDEENIHVYEQLKTVKL